MSASGPSAAPHTAAGGDAADRTARHESLCPVATSSTSSSSCPVPHGDRLFGTIGMTSPSNEPSSSQHSALNTHRQTSSIPMAQAPHAAAAGSGGGCEAAAVATVPAHQSGVDGRGSWVYPSEQMFYNALKRKGWNPEETDIPAVVAIHNAVNERAWTEVLRWERMHAWHCNCPKLKRFRGRPRDYSPKAQFLNLLGYKLPFDRHDWIVDRCGTEVRYVIDFYRGAAQHGAAASLHIDARPALDSFTAVVDRARMTLRMVARQLYGSFSTASSAAEPSNGSTSQQTQEAQR